MNVPRDACSHTMRQSPTILMRRRIYPCSVYCGLSMNVSAGRPLKGIHQIAKRWNDLEERKATHSETYLALGLSVYYHTRTIGMLQCAADMMGMDEAAAELREVAEENLEYLTREYSVIPIHDLVRIQTASALVSMKLSVEYLLNFVTD